MLRSHLFFRSLQQSWPARLLLAGLLLGTLTWAAFTVWASPASKPVSQASPIHPNFPLLDSGGVNVLESGAPVSTMQTCGACHDTDYIASHSFHADLGLSAYTTEETESNLPWNSSNGLFGKFDPLTYRFLSQEGDERLDLSTAEWIKVFGARIAGGGPAVTSREGQALTSLAPDANNPETSLLDPQTGQPITWDWAEFWRAGTKLPALPLTSTEQCCPAGSDPGWPLCGSRYGYHAGQRHCREEWPAMGLQCGGLRREW